MRWFVLSLLVLVSCNEAERARVVDTTVDWDPAKNLFHVQTRLHDVDQALFGCADLDAPACLDNVRTALHVPAEPSGSALGVDYALGASLVQGGATHVSMHIERKDKAVDLVASWDAPPGSGAAEWTDVTVEREGRPGKEKAHLIVQMARGRTIDATRYTHRLTTTIGSHGPQQDEVISLPRKVHAVHVHTESGQKITPLLQIKGMDDALVQAGLLPAPGK